MGAAGRNNLLRSFCTAVQWFVNSAVTALFTKPPAEPFLAFPGTIPVEQKKSLKQRMGQWSPNTIPAGGRQSGGLVDSSVKLKVTHSDSPVLDKNFF